MSKTYVKQQSELGAFAFILFVVGIIFITNLLINLGADEKYVLEVKSTAELLRKFFPEGEPLYTKAVETATYAYLIKNELRERYSSNVQILVNLMKGSISVPVSHLILGSLAKYVLALGFIKGLTLKVFKVALFAPLILTAAVILRKKLGFFRDIADELYARLYDPFGDRDIRTVLKVLRANPVPASIIHHLPEKGGLLKHSLHVAIRAADKAGRAGLNPREAYLAGLLHDAGKLKVYVFDPERGTYRRAGANHEVMNRMVMKELDKRFGVRVPSDENVWELVKEADREVTVEELKEMKMDISSVIEQALRELNINGIEGKKYDGWYKETLPFVAILAHAMNRVVTRLLRERDPALPLSEEPDHAGVHVLAYANPYRKLIYTEFEGKRADELGLFDARIGTEVFRAVYLVKKEAVPGETLLRWGNTPYDIEVLERKRYTS
ncbi:MAG TPA: HD domain-containing protein [Aigarchaeota archaeon]|nr:HD domain-containing protein [Aigarchaeota archaeon]